FGCQHRIASFREGRNLDFHGPRVWPRRGPARWHPPERRLGGRNARAGSHDGVRECRWLPNVGLDWPSLPSVATEARRAGPWWRDGARSTVPARALGVVLSPARPWT